MKRRGFCQGLFIALASALARLMGGQHKPESAFPGQLVKEARSRDSESRLEVDWLVLCKYSEKATVACALMDTTLVRHGVQLRPSFVQVGDYGSFGSDGQCVVWVKYIENAIGSPVIYGTLLG